ncbi:hypothetical protein JOD57_004702 [Geodermatophilus bullaregiensis]|uniref:hypothetical protein n=1 Tax=Geodermatophilus bullaregiensis TaxID=1564160 RepID=UPI00195A21FE|nr:hypothetical protein [Geodermatophilus bullaregiensis]MBM7808865.1 hypothetical protein [Geodermatophilus bullaregiensis]
MATDSRIGPASLVATQIGVPPPEADDEARARWTAIVESFLAGVQPGRRAGADDRGPAGTSTPRARVQEA